MTEKIIRLNHEYLGNNIQKTVITGLFGALGVLFMLYTYFIGSIIFGGVEERRLNASIRDLRSEVGTLEVAYLTLSGELTIGKAKSLGFTEAKEQSFAVRRGAALRNITLGNGI